MKMIKPGFKIYEIPDATDYNGVLMHLEKIGRTCYKSEDKITETSAIKFIDNLRKRKHWAMLEHYIFTLSIPKRTYDGLMRMKCNTSTMNNSDILMKFSYIHLTHCIDLRGTKYEYLLSFSATALNYLMDCVELRTIDHSPLLDIYNFMCKDYLILMQQYDDIAESSELNDEISFLLRDEIKSLPNWLRDIHDFASVKFTVDRGVTHELVRHRPASWAQESTRYCNYSQGKFGEEITVIIPTFFDTEMELMSNSFVFNEWKTSCERSEDHYFKLLSMGATPQEARTVLPNSLKADIIMTATLHEFRHFFDMRCPSGAHPQMREVSLPLLADFSYHNEYYKGIFNDQTDLLYDYKNINKWGDNNEPVKS